MGHFARSRMQKNICYFSASLSIELIACGKCKLKILLGYLGQSGHYREILYACSCINPPDYKSGCSVIPRHGPMAVQNKIKVELIV